MYEDEIAKLQVKFESLSKKLSEMPNKTLETLNLNDRRCKVFDKLLKLKRLQWEQTNT